MNPQHTEETAAAAAFEQAEHYFRSGAGAENLKDENLGRHAVARAAFVEGYRAGAGLDDFVQKYGGAAPGPVMEADTGSRVDADGAVLPGRERPRRIGRMGDVLEHAARSAHEVLRAYADGRRDGNFVPWDAASEADRAETIERVRTLLASPDPKPGEVVTARDHLFRAAAINAAHAAGWSPDTGPMARALAEGAAAAAASPDRVGHDGTVPVAPQDVGAIAMSSSPAAVAAATGRPDRTDEFFEERRRRLTADKPANPAGRPDGNAMVGSTQIDNTPDKDA
jgi:hypothetical protein